MPMTVRHEPAPLISREPMAMEYASKIPILEGEQGCSDQLSGDRECAEGKCTGRT